MTTKIELGSYTTIRLKNNGVRSEEYRISSERTLMGKIPDEPGEYDIVGGKISMGFSSDNNGHKFVDLGLEANNNLGRFLKGGKERSVCISNKGEGHIFLPKGRVLFVATQAAAETFTVIDRKK